MSKINKIININTINQNIELLLQNNDTIIDKLFDNNTNSQAESLVLLIEQLLQNNSIEYKDLDYIAIVNGPGSFIGLKTSIAIIKAMQVLLLKPIIVNNLFEIISYQQNFDYIVLNGDFASYYIQDKNLNYFYVKKNEIDEFIKNKNAIILTNNQTIVEELKAFKPIMIEYNYNNIIELNYQKLKNNQFCEHLEALYIKPPQINRS